MKYEHPPRRPAEPGLAEGRLGVGWVTFARHLSGYGIAKVVPGIIGVITVPLWVRVFGEGGYAAYTIVWVVAIFSSALAVGWLRQALLRYSGLDGFNLGAVPRWVVGMSVGLAAVPVALAGAIVPSSSAQNQLVMAVTALVFGATNALYGLYLAAAQRDGEVRRYSVAEIARASGALLVSLALGLLLDAEPVIAILGGYALATLVASAVLVVGKRRRAPREEVGEGRALEMWRYGWPMSIWLAFAQVLVYFDRIVLSFFLPADAVGSYAASADLIIRGISMVAFPLTMLAHPIVMKYWNRGDKVGASRVNRHYFLLVSLLGAVCILGVALVGEPLIAALLGVDVPAPSVLILLAAGAALWQVAQQAHKPLELHGRTKLMTTCLVVISAAVLATSLLLVPILGTLASALVFAIGALSYVVAVIGFSIRTERHSQ